MSYPETTAKKAKANGPELQQRGIIARVEVVCLGLLATLFAVYWSICSLLIHRSFHSNGWDLGLINQMLWNTAHGRFFEYSFRDISYAGDHWQPFLLTLVPLKWLRPGPELLLVAQAIALSAAVLPLYLAVRRAGRSFSIALACAYLLGLGVQRAVSFDFHAEAFAPLLAFTALYGLVGQRRVVFVVSSLLILTLKEDGALLTLAICWIGWFAFKERAIQPVAVVSVIYGFLAAVIIIPHFRGADLNPFAERYGYLGQSPPGVLWGIVSRPNLVAAQLARIQALEAVAIVLASAALLPLLLPRLLPALALVVLLPLLSKEPAQGSLDFHYLLIPSTVALSIAAVTINNHVLPAFCFKNSSELAKSALRQTRITAPLTLLGTSVGLSLLLSPLPPSISAHSERFDVDHHAAVARAFMREVPPKAIVSAQSAFIPHLSDREKIYQFPRVLDAEIVIVDTNGPIPADDIAAGYMACLAALPRLGFEEVHNDDGISLWQKMRPAEAVPEVPVACSGQHPNQ